MANKPQYCLGTVQWGLDYGISNQNGIPSNTELREIIRIALRNKVFKIDTAENYGASELKLGKLISKHKDYFEIVTKVYISQNTLESNEKIIIQSVRDSVYGSLTKLKLKKLNTVLLHEGKYAIHKNLVAWSTLRDLQNLGLIHKIGFSASNPKEAQLAFELPNCQVVQVASSLLDQRLFRTNFFDRAHANGIETFVRSIFLQGIAFLDVTQIKGRLRELIPMLMEIEEFSKDLKISKSDVWRVFASTINTNYLILGCTNRKELSDTLNFFPETKIEIEVKKFAHKIGLYSDNVLDPSHWGIEETERKFKSSK